MKLIGEGCGTIGGTGSRPVYAERRDLCGRAWLRVFFCA